MTRESPENPNDVKAPSPEFARRDLELLWAVRRIMQGFDVHSRRLAGASQITLPQLLCLTAVVANEGMTSRQIASEIFASASTLVGVLDRLETKQLIDRVRDPRDRRQIHILPTHAGRKFIAAAPSPFGESFDSGFGALSSKRQVELVDALSQMAELMGTPEASH